MIVRYDPRYQDAFLKMCAAMHAESRYRAFDWSPAKVLKLIALPTTFCALSLRDQQPAGFIIGVVQPFWFSAKTKQAFDLAVYVMPGHRGGMAAARLIKAFEAFAHEHKCAEINLSSSAEISNDLALRLYERLGYESYGFLTKKNLA